MILTSLQQPMLIHLTGPMYQALIQDPKSLTSSATLLTRQVRKVIGPPHMSTRRIESTQTLPGFRRGRCVMELQKSQSRGDKYMMSWRSINRLHEDYHRRSG